MRTMAGLTRRQMLLSVPTVAFARQALAVGSPSISQPGGAAPIRVRAINHLGLAVSDPKRSVDFYQGLFGMPIQARVESTTILRIGAGPQFISIAPVAANTSPSINHFCLGVEGFGLDRVLAALAAHGVAKSETVGPMKASVTMRGDAADLLFGDPDGIVCQLQAADYCGGSGPLGNVCKNVERSTKKGLIALRDLNHLTIFSPDSARANKFYQDLFGFGIRSYQGPTAPTLAVGPTVEFLMFTGGGAPARGAAPAAPRPASINHGCMTIDTFKPDEVLKTLETFGLKPRETAQGPVGPMRHYVTMRMENRGGAPEGTPELYFTDPDGILMQLQDTSYCGGSGFLGNSCR